MALTRKERLGLMSARRAALDVKAAQSDLDGKAAIVHSHAISDVSGLQTALDGKAAIVHSHAISDVSGLQTALDGKQPTGSYVLTVNYSWDALPGKPSTFPPSAHSHVIADVTGLQTALDAKLATANFTWNSLSGKPTTFAPSAHSHAISDVSGLQAALDGKQPVGPYLTGITSGMVATALGFTPANKAGDTFSGPVTFSGGITQGFTISAHGGFEGGQFNLAKPETTSLVADVAVDVVGNSVRIFEDGGTARGVYVDLTANSAGAGSRILTDTTLTSGNVTSALGFTPYNATNPAGYISGITSGMVTTALGYTPYSSSNPAGYISGITSGMVTTALGYTPASLAGATFTGGVTIPDLVVSDSLPVYTNGGFQYHQFQSPHVAFVKKSGGYQWYWRRNDTGLAGGANEVEDMSLTEAGTLVVRGDMRAPIFYDSNDTAWYVDPNGTSRIYRLKVASETAYPGSINGDYEGGYYHFGPSNDTPAGSYGHAHIIRLDANWNVQMFFPTSNNNEPMWIRRKQNGTYSTWRRMLQEDEWIGSKYLASDGRIYGTIFYDSDNSGYYVDPASTSNLNDIRGSYIRCYGSVDVDSDLYVGTASGKTSSYIYMKDSDEGDRAIHCNSNRIGFLRQDGGWGAWCEDDGSWRNTSYIQTPIIYDINNTGYYVDPAGSSFLNAVTFDGLAAGRTSASTDVNSANDTGSFSVRGSATTVAAMSFHRAGAYAMNMGLGTDNVFRIGGWSASSNCFQMDGSGNLTVLGNVTAYSDARLKKDVETISGALDMVSAMRGVRYTRIDSGQRQVGVIAQEMQEIVPEVVQQGIGDDDTLSVAYGNLVGVLIEAVKELRAEVEALKSQGTMK